MSVLEWIQLYKVIRSVGVIDYMLLSFNLLSPLKPTSAIILLLLSIQDWNCILI